MNNLDKFYKKAKEAFPDAVELDVKIERASWCEGHRYDVYVNVPYDATTSGQQDSMDKAIEVLKKKLKP